MPGSRVTATIVAIMASSALLAACGGGAKGVTATNTGGGGGCTAGAAGSGTAVTVAQEADAGVSAPTSKCWASIKPTPITQIGSGTIPAGDTTTFQVAWSPKALYILSYTAEWPLSNAGGANWWQSDTTEFTVSGSDDHGGSFDSKTFQFGVVNDGSLQQGTGAATAPAQPTPQAKIVPNKGFYAELTVPWNILGVSAPKKGQKYQFDIAQDYADSGGNRVAQAVWAGDGTFYNNTTNWGDITLG